MGVVNVVWAETKRQSPGSRRRVVAVSTRRGEREAEKLKKQEARERRRNFADLYWICSSAGGATPNRNVIT